VREDGAGEDHGGETKRDLRSIVGDGVDHQVAPGRDGLAEPLVEEAECEAGEGQDIDEELVMLAMLGDEVEEEEEEGGRAAADDADARAEQCPRREGFQEWAEGCRHPYLAAVRAARCEGAERWR
jgi:hypothetical protein